VLVCKMQITLMEPYVGFCRAQLRSTEIIDDKCEKNLEFASFCKQFQDNPQANRMPLQSYLLKPMQRITRYPLLISKVGKKL